MPASSTPPGDTPDLTRALGDPGYTPSTRALPALLDRLIAGPDEHVAPLTRALVSAGAPALAATRAALERHPPDRRARLVGVLARLAGEITDETLLPALLAALDEPEIQTRKQAARGLAKLGDARAEARLLTLLQHAHPNERKNLVDALGAVGGHASLPHLAAQQADDADLQRRLQRARLMIERRSGRDVAARLLLDEPLPYPQRVALSCRAGLAELLAAELAQFASPEPRTPTRVDVLHGGTLRELLAARTSLDVALVLPLPDSARGAPEDRIADALARPEHVALLQRWTDAVPRFRVAWTGGGHRRSLTWALARALSTRTTALVNDSHAALWTLRAPPDARGELLLVPRLDPDPRFDYRRADVPAASHPTIAAALARFAGVAPDEVVWDPFVGSAQELIERARLGPVRALIGTDLDPRALAAARQNATAAGLTSAEFHAADALTFRPPAPSLIITNPPMGRRVARDGSVPALLETFITHAANVLRPGGRLVWLSPLAPRTERHARALGLDIHLGPHIDLGGFTAQLQRFTRPK